MKNHFIYLVVCLIGSTFGFISCESNEGLHHIQDYYFPYESFKNGGKIYEFAPIVNDTLIAGKNDIVLSEYYKYEYFENDSADILVTTFFDKFCRQAALYRNEVVQNGVLQADARIFEYPNDTSKPIVNQVNIEVNNVFLFEVKDSSAILYKIEYTDATTGTRYALAFKRTFKGMTTHLYKGKAYKAIEFDVTKRVTIYDLNEGDFYQEVHEVERYAKGLGLVYYTSLEVQYELVDMIDMNNFIKKCDELFFRDY